MSHKRFSLNSVNTNNRNSLVIDPESGTNTNEFTRKRSLVRNDRSSIGNDPQNMRYHYFHKLAEQRDHIVVNPSAADLLEQQQQQQQQQQEPIQEEEHDQDIPLQDFSSPSDDYDNDNDNIYEDQSTLPMNAQGRVEYGLNDTLRKEPSFIRTKSLNKKKKPLITNTATTTGSGLSANASSNNKTSLWQAYCHVITFWAPGPLLKLCGFPTKKRQFAWREKIALISIILYLGTFIAYITFGFSATVCKQTGVTLRNNQVSDGYLIINGRAYDLTHSTHPAAAGIDSGSNVLYPPINAGGMDASFLFQNVNGNCKGLITPKDNCSIPYDDDEDLAWYMPCNLFNQDGSTDPNFTVPYYDGWACHTSTSARDAYYDLDVTGNVFFTWDDIKNSSRNLVVYAGDVLDMDLVDWFLTDDIDYPELFDNLKNDPYMQGHDISMLLSSSEERQAAKCLVELIKVGIIDSSTIGCIASNIVLVISLILILANIVAKFVIACYFKWVVARRQGYNEMSIKDMQQREQQIDHWSNNVFDKGPIKDIKKPNTHARSQSRLSLFPKTSRLSLGADKIFDPFTDDAKMALKKNENDDYDDDNDLIIATTNAVNSKYITMGTQMAKMAAEVNENNNKHNRRRSTFYGKQQNNNNNDSGLFTTQTRNSIIMNPFDTVSNFGGNNDNMIEEINSLSVDIIHPDVVPQPPIDYEPFGFPLAHTICLVTCYSEDEDGLRTTLDSISTSDFPNSHKLIFVVCDGLIKGHGNELTTPEIALSMMDDFTTPPEDVLAHSYVSVAQGAKRHNMAKVYAGFYKYDDLTMPAEKQQRVPMITVVKCGTPEEMTAAKPGNRGKRDSQIILMSFLQKIMFDERMSALEFDLFLNVWKITGLMAEVYECVLMVDADTKVYPDSLAHMVTEMVKDPEVMGLCGETKISNKAQSWVTAIQVFEYYISHHQAKAFESVFGCVTCLPGCFSMYRIKAPKGQSGYWVPILANPDIVERYSENVVETLHQKNLLLLGEDRYLSSLMLRTFPKRKQVFLPKAACKTIAPDTFKVLLSQRRRWINSTVHNLMELVLIKDLCGTFCFSMQFVIAMELVSTLVLPAAIVFTLYVIIYAIVSKPTPVMTLVLLGIIFGLPALLVIITVSNVMYIFWLLCYMLALPVWNFVLPAYAYWKFDDFSWGDTRKTAMDGAKSGGSHGDETEGEFNGSHIVQKRWREFERLRRGQMMNDNKMTPAWDPAAAAAAASTSQINLLQ